MTQLYVGHLSEEVTEADLRALFEPYGIESMEIMADKTTKRARGFAFVYISGDAVAAVSATNGVGLYDRKIVVKAML